MKEMGLDLKDKKILFELDKNSRINLPKLAKKVNLSKEVVFYRIQNLVKRGIILRFQAVVSAYMLGFQSYKMYFKFQNLTKNVRSEIENFLMENEMVYWLSHCQGRWDMIVAVWAKHIQDFGKFEDEILNRFSNYILEKDISISRITIQYNRRWFYYDKLEPVETGFGENLRQVKLDVTDYKILRLLADNARVKIIDIANKLDVSVTVVRYRINQLEKKNVILGYKYALNSKLLGYETCKAFISFKNVTEIRKKSLINYCKMIPNVINVVLTIGSWDMEVEVEVENFEKYYQIMSDMQERYNDIIKRYDSVLFSSEPKQIFMPKVCSDR